MPFAGTPMFMTTADGHPYLFWLWWPVGLSSWVLQDYNHWRVLTATPAHSKGQQTQELDELIVMPEA